jgi:NAD(P)H-dependent FMN reductase
MDEKLGNWFPDGLSIGISICGDSQKNNFKNYTMKTIIISGSPRKESVTCRVAEFLHSSIANSELIDVRRYPLSMVDTVWSKDELVPESGRELHSKMRSADAFILVTPEYNGGYSPAMKNLLDHFPKDVFARKAMGLVTASTGAFGGMRAAQQMQQMACAFFAVPCPHMLVVPNVDKKFGARGVLLDEGFRASAERFMNEFDWLSKSLYIGKKS